MNNDKQGPERLECDVLVIGAGPAGSTVSPLLAGDVFGGAPIGRSLLAFKALCFAANLLQPRRAFTAWRNRRANIRPVDGAALAQTL